MKFIVTQIEFDFDSDILDTEEMTDEDCQEIIDETMSTTWEADDEDDLIEEITAATGWCISSIDYEIQLTQWHKAVDTSHHLPYIKHSSNKPMSTTAIRDYFTDKEWDAIDQAMGDFQDYGEEEAEHADNIRYKIGMLFRKS